MNVETRFELQFLAKDLRNRNVDLRALYADCGDDDGQAEEAIGQAIKHLDRAARCLDLAVGVVTGQNLQAFLALSVEQLREKHLRRPGLSLLRGGDVQRCEEVGGGGELA